MDDKNSTRIQGTVTDFNGIVGRASGPDGKVYTIHISNFEPECRGTAKDLLRPDSVIEFSVTGTTLRGMNGRANHITLIECSPLPTPTDLPIGYWQDFRGYRCSSCGERHADKHAFCPDCGAKMYEKEVYDLLVPRLVCRKTRDEICVDRSDYTESQWSAICGLFGTYPDIASGLSIDPAVVLSR